jgi:AcrR family transcriptional regulator
MVGPADDGCDPGDGTATGEIDISPSPPPVRPRPPDSFADRRPDLAGAHRFIESDRRRIGRPGTVRTGRCDHGRPGCPAGPGHAEREDHGHQRDAEGPDRAEAGGEGVPDVPQQGLVVPAGGLPEAVDPGASHRELHTVYTSRNYTRCEAGAGRCVGLPEPNARSRRTRLALLAAARTLVEQKGLPALTMASVAEQAGVTRRSVYLHFATRTELVTALYEYVNETTELATSLQSVWQASDAPAALERWAQHLTRCHLQLVPFGRAFQRVRGTDPDAEHYWELVMRQWRGSCRRLAEWLAAEQRLATTWTVPTATDMLWALMSFDVLEALAVDRRWSRKRLARKLTALLQSTFVAPAAATGKATRKADGR